jgi:hypothetical protein
MRPLLSLRLRTMPNRPFPDGELESRCVFGDHRAGILQLAETRTEPEELVICQTV